MPQTKLLILENSTLDVLAGRSDVLQILPFLRSLKQAPQKRKCGSCGGNAGSRVRADTYAAAKRTIGGLPQASKQALKRALNTSGIRVVYRDEKNRVIQLTF